MWLTVGEIATDTDDKHRSVRLGDGILTFLGSHPRIHGDEFLGMNELDFIR